MGVKGSIESDLNVSVTVKFGGEASNLGSQGIH